jgi:DNA-binding MarR family transcriptional regulator
MIEPLLEDPTPLSLGPAADFMRSLWALSHAMERLSLRMEAVIGVTAQQRMLIRCVGRYPGITSGQLAAHFCLDAGTVSTALRRLEEKRLLVRRRDPRDGRRVTLGLTPAGRKVDEAREGTVEQAIHEALEKARPADLEGARVLLAALSASIVRELEERSRP